MVWTYYLDNIARVIRVKANRFMGDVDDVSDVSHYNSAM